MLFEQGNSPSCLVVIMVEVMEVVGAEVVKVETFCLNAVAQEVPTGLLLLIVTFTVTFVCALPGLELLRLAGLTGFGGRGNGGLVTVRGGLTCTGLPGFGVRGVVLESLSVS